MKSWLKKSFSLSLLASSLLALGLSTTNVQAADVPEGTVLAPQQILQAEVGDNPRSIDPTLISEGVGMVIGQQLFEMLVNYDANGKIIPGVAQTWTPSADFKTWTFKLRPNAKWSDGSPVTAHDFVTSWQRLADPKTASEYSYYLADMQVVNAQDVIDGKKDKAELGVKAIDDYTFEVQLTNPVPWFIEAVSLICLAPVPSKLLAAGQWPNFDNYVSNGAYVLKAGIPNEKYTLVKNEHYWNANKAVITEANFNIIRNANDAYKRLQAGDLHAFRLSTPSLLQALKADSNYKVVQTPGAYSVWYGFNLSKPPFDDLKTRQAILYAIDTKELESKVFRGTVQATSLYASRAIPNVDKYLKESAYFNEPMEQRIAKAKELLAQAGYSESNPLRFTISYNTNETYKLASIAIQAQLKKAFGNSVATNLNNQEWATFLNSRHSGLLSFFRSGWGADYYEPSTFYALWQSKSTLNESRFINKEYDELYASIYTLGSEEERFKVYARLNEILNDQAGGVPLYSSLDSYAMVKNLYGYHVDDKLRRVFNSYLIAPESK